MSKTIENMKFYWWVNKSFIFAFEYAFHQKNDYLHKLMTNWNPTFTQIVKRMTMSFIIIIITELFAGN